MAGMGATPKAHVYPEVERETVFAAHTWPESAPESTGIDPARLADALHFLAANSGHDRNGEFVIIRNGWLVVKGDNIDRVHGIWSCTKSVTSTVLGLLVADGKCTLETRVADILPELELRYSGVTLRHFATMTSGYRAEGDDIAGGHGQSRTPFAPAVPGSEPGERFTYWDSAMNKFAEALTVIAGEPLDAIFKRRIADAIGMNPAQWRWGNRGEQRGFVINGGAGNGGAHIFTSARELARFAVLFLNEGRWDGRQVIAAEWVAEATQPHVGHYGLNWWTNRALPEGNQKWPGAPASTFGALGHNNNHLFIIPDWDMVVVRLGLDQREVKMSDAIWSEFFRLLGAGISDRVCDRPQGSAMRAGAAD